MVSGHPRLHFGSQGTITAFPFSTGSIKACDLLGFEPSGGGEAGLSALGSG